MSKKENNDMSATKTVSIDEEKTKIIASIGRWRSVEDLVNMIKAGMSVARFNFSHGGSEKFSSILKNLRKAEEITDQKIKVLGDTQGIEIRTTNFILESLLVEKGDILFIKKEADESFFDNISFSITHFDEVYKSLVKGDVILIDDGALEFIVEEVNDNTIKVKALNNGTIKERKGVNIPDIDLDIPFLSEKDKEDIRFMVENNFEYIALSFVRNCSDLNEVETFIDSINPDYVGKIISKIECQEAINNLDSIIEASDGIMVARGDLGVEIPYWEVPYLQEVILNKMAMWRRSYNRLPILFDKKEVIVATQMLESMTENPKPTRAEVTDVWNAKRQGADYVMLSGETCAGDFPIEAIKKILDFQEYNKQPSLTKVHMTVQYKCSECNRIAEFFCEEGVEEVFNPRLTLSEEKPNKPIPFNLDCPLCKGTLLLSPITSFKTFPCHLMVDNKANIMAYEEKEVEAVPVWGDPHFFM